MPDTSFGVDSGNKKVDGSLIASVKGVFGDLPMFWGRTFNAKEAGNFEPGEVKLLATNEIRILPMARQDVGGKAADGAQDAKDNVAALLKAIPLATLKAQGDRFYLFLDAGRNLSRDYYQAWHKGVLSAGGGLIRPCVHVHADADDAIDVIGTIKDRPEALWIANWQRDDGNAKRPTGKWDPLGQPNNTKIPIVLWQYTKDDRKGFSCSWVNPDLGMEGLGRYLPLPPGATMPATPFVSSKPAPAKPEPPKPIPPTPKPTPAPAQTPAQTTPSNAKQTPSKQEPSALDDVRSGKVMLKPGSKGAAVKELQQGLVDRGYKLDVDGAFGPGTAGAVKKFQKDQKLGADGIVGPATMKAFDAAPPKS